MAKITWAELDQQRQELPRRMSRAELARRAGISESTITKGIKAGSAPQKTQRQRVELALAGERAAIEGGLR